jgi:ABC-2 type transport system ATP-binding protein
MMTDQQTSNRPTSGNTAMRVSGVTKYYRAGMAALAEVSFTVNTGECFALLGVNGAGKTTLIKCLLGLSRESQGELSILEQSTHRPWTRNQLAYLPERFAPPPWLTVNDYLKLAANLYAQDWKKAQKTGKLGELGMKAGTLDLPLRECSKGMIQKTGLTAALLSGRPLLVLDEPMSGLDPFSRTQVKQQLNALKAEQRTVVMCTHSLADVAEMADRLALLHEGQLRFIGTPAEWLAATATQSLEQAFLTSIGCVTPQPIPTPARLMKWRG